MLDLQSAIRKAQRPPKNQKQAEVSELRKADAYIHAGGRASSVPLRRLSHLPYLR